MKNLKSFDGLNEAKISQPKDMKFVSVDYKDVDGMAKQFQKVLKSFGINMYEDPTTKGSDQYSFFITKEKLSNKQLNDIAREIYPD